MGYFTIPEEAYPKYTVGMLTPKTATTTVAGGKVKPKAGVIGISGQPIPGAASVTATTATDPGTFNINPTPQTGQGPFGAVPGTVAYPTTPYAEATRIYPGLSNLTPAVGQQIASQVAGEFTPQEENTLWDIANRYGVASGMPGAGLWSNKFMGNVIDARQKRIQEGITNYNNMLAQLSKMGVDPALAAQIAAWNATNAAAPNPEEAANKLREWYQQQLNAGASPAGGTISRMSPNMYGSGFTPTFGSPAGGTIGTSSISPVANLAPSQGTKTANQKYLGTMSLLTGLDRGEGRAWNSEGGYASTTEGNAPYVTPIYQDEYDWLWNQSTPTETYNPFPTTDYGMTEDEFNWLWNEATPTTNAFTGLSEEDPWAFYE